MARRKRQYGSGWTPGHLERWKLLRYDAGHMETADGGRQEILTSFKRFL